MLLLPMVTVMRSPIVPAVVNFHSLTPAILGAEPFQYNVLIANASWLR